MSTHDLDVSLPYIASGASFPSTVHVHLGLSSSQAIQSSLYVPFSSSIMFFSFVQFNFGGTYQPRDLQLEDSSLRIITREILKCDCTWCSYINTTTNVCSLNNHVIQWQWHTLCRRKSVPSCNAWLLVSAGCLFLCIRPHGAHLHQTALLTLHFPLLLIPIFIILLGNGTLPVPLLLLSTPVNTPFNSILHGPGHLSLIQQLLSTTRQ